VTAVDARPRVDRTDVPLLVAVLVEPALELGLQAAAQPPTPLVRFRDMMLDEARQDEFLRALLAERDALQPLLHIRAL
jgi:hypothetical protein